MPSCSMRKASMSKPPSSFVTTFMSSVAPPLCEQLHAGVNAETPTTSTARPKLRISSPPLTFKPASNLLLLVEREIGEHAVLFHREIADHQSIVGRENRLIEIITRRLFVSPLETIGADMPGVDGDDGVARVAG